MGKVHRGWGSRKKYEKCLRHKCKIVNHLFGHSVDERNGTISWKTEILWQGLLNTTQRWNSDCFPQTIELIKAAVREILWHESTAWRFSNVCGEDSRQGKAGGRETGLETTVITQVMKGKPGQRQGPAEKSHTLGGTLRGSGKLLNWGLEGEKPRWNKAGVSTLGSTCQAWPPACFPQQRTVQILLFFFFCHTTQHVELSQPGTELTHYALGVRRVLTTGLPQKSPIFTFLNGWGKNILWQVDTQMSASTHKVLLEHRHTRWFTCCLCLL